MRKFLYVLGALAVILLLFVSIKYLTVKSIDESTLEYVQFEKSVGLKRVSKNGKWALLDESNRPVTNFEYDYIGEFSSNKSEILKNEKYGFIDGNANVVVEPKYDLVFGYNNGVAKVLLNGKYGVVDEKGVELIKPDYYDYISEFDYRGVANARKGNKDVIIDKYGKVQK